MRNPLELGMPKKFGQWRQHQYEAAQRFAESDKRFTVQAAPTGSGKSLIYFAAAALAKASRVVVLTRTKALQDQLFCDFQDLGPRDIRGRSSYQCDKDPNWTVDHAICNFGFDCHLMQSGCTYFDALREARSAKLLISNYHWWITTNRMAQETGLQFQCTPDVLIMDEAHEAPATLLDMLTISLSNDKCEKFLLETLPDLETPQQWAKWAGEADLKLMAQHSSMMEEQLLADRRMRYVASELMGFRKSLAKVADMTNNWHVLLGEKGVSFVPHGYNRETVEDLLLGDARRVWLTSATVNRQVPKMLRIERGEYNYHEVPSTFDAERRPITHVRTIRVDRKTSSEDIAEFLVPRIDQIIRQRQTYKGILLARSYKLANEIVGHSQFQGQMFVPRPKAVPRCVQEFKAAAPPAILVSPAVGTGYDFPLDECRYIIIPKMPFGDRGDPLGVIWRDWFDGYDDFCTAQELVQWCGRGMRSETDACEAFVLDDHVEWWYRKHSKLLPSWFREAFQSKMIVPKSILPKFVSKEVES